MQSLLESHGIKTFIKNQFGSSVMGEVPFVEVVPQLYVLDEKDLGQAKQLLLLDLPVEQPESDWVCNECGVEVDGTFHRCWNCGSDRV